MPLDGSHPQRLWQPQLVLQIEARVMAWGAAACEFEVRLRRRMRMCENSIWQKLMEKSASLLAEMLLHF